MYNRKIKVQFSDFWPNFTPVDFYLYKILSKKYILEISSNPDILFYSVYGRNHCKYTCTKVLFTGENFRANFFECDFAFSFDYSDNQRSYRLPLFALYDDVSKLIKKKILDSDKLNEKKKFCCFVVSNPNNEIRNNFFKLLSKYKHVDSAGALYNNIGGQIDSKRAFIREYKFVIAFENSSYPGYVTEKIFEPLLEDCIPIYWGTDTVGQDFNSKRFINCHDFSSFEDVVKHILEVDKNDQKYNEYLNEPAFPGNVLPLNLREENISERLRHIFESHKNRSIFTRIKYYVRPQILYFIHQLSRFQNLVGIILFL